MIPYGVVFISLFKCNFLLTLKNKEVFALEYFPSQIRYWKWYVSVQNIDVRYLDLDKYFHFPIKFINHS